MPVTVRILLENLLRHAGGVVDAGDVETLASWQPGEAAEAEIPFMPSRVIMQDLTGVPAVVDLAAMRDAMGELGGDPSRVNPLVPADLVIDHSVQVDRFGTSDAFAFNVGREYERNGERYQLLRWAQTTFRNLRIVPPGTGIVHQVNLEFLAPVVDERDGGRFPRHACRDRLAYHDDQRARRARVRRGWDRGRGRPARPTALPADAPRRRRAADRELPSGSTATDLVLVVTEMLRKHGVVGAFVEFAGDGVAGLSLADRATISNMSPEFGATATLFPIDDETLSYLRLTGRSTERVDLVERYAKEQGLWREPGEGPAFDELLTLDLATVEPSVAGPRRPQDRVPLRDLRENFRSTYPNGLETPGEHARRAEPPDDADLVGEASSESFPASDPPAFASSAMVDAPAPPVRRGDTRSRSAGVPQRAGLDRRRGDPAELRLRRHRGDHLLHEHVEPDGDGRGRLAGPKRRCARPAGGPDRQDVAGPGLKGRDGLSRRSAGLMEPLERLGFALAGYGCTTCIGNSGPLDAPVATAVEENDLIVAAVLSGNRNFEGRIHPLARASYLASPPLVVAFALAGRVDIDLTTEPLGTGRDGRPVHLADIWPSAEEIRTVIGSAIDPELFQRTYAVVFEGDERWQALPIPEGDRYAWDAVSTYVARPPFFEGLTQGDRAISDITGRGSWRYWATR